MSGKTRHIEDQEWLRTVRADLDSDAEDWVVQTNPRGISKLEAIGAYLDVILTDLGVKGRLHVCPECGQKHLRNDR